MGVDSEVSWHEKLFPGPQPDCLGLCPEEGETPWPSDGGMGSVVGDWDAKGVRGLSGTGLQGVRAVRGLHEVEGIKGAKGV